MGIDHRRESKHLSKVKKQVASKNMYMKLLVKVREEEDERVAVQVLGEKSRKLLPQGRAAKTHAIQSPQTYHVYLPHQPSSQGQVPSFQ